MPFLQVMTSRANRVFRLKNLAKLNVEDAAPGRDLKSVAQAYGIATTNREMKVLDAVPGAIQDAILGVVRYAIKNRTPLYFGWSPAYDYSVKVWEARSVEDSPAAVSIHIEGPYPDKGRP